MGEVRLSLRWSGNLHLNLSFGSLKTWVQNGLLRPYFCLIYPYIFLLISKMIPCPDMPLGTWRVKSLIRTLSFGKNLVAKGNFRMMNIHYFKVIAVRVHRKCQSSGLGCTGPFSYLLPHYRLFFLCMYKDALYVINLPVSLINTKAFCACQLVCLGGTFPDHLQPALWRKTDGWAFGSWSSWDWLVL